MQKTHRNGNKVIAKNLRKEIAIPFMQAPPEAFVQSFIEQREITPPTSWGWQTVSMADDITVEGRFGWALPIIDR